MGRSKSKREEIEERRQKILQLQSMGYSQYAIIKQLGNYKNDHVKGHEKH
jgi:uncharacterized UBP type Zn finger protein